jgi:hypothetical protein
VLQPVAADVTNTFERASGCPPLPICRRDFLQLCVQRGGTLSKTVYLRNCRTQTSIQAAVGPTTYHALFGYLRISFNNLGLRLRNRFTSTDELAVRAKYPSNPRELMLSLGRSQNHGYWLRSYCPASGQGYRVDCKAVSKNDLGNEVFTEALSQERQLIWPFIAVFSTLQGN